MNTEQLKNRRDQLREELRNTTDEDTKRGLRRRLEKTRDELDQLRGW